MVIVLLRPYISGALIMVFFVLKLTSLSGCTPSKPCFAGLSVGSFIVIIIIIIIAIIALEGASRDFLKSSQCANELSPTRTLKWPRRSWVKIICSTQSAYHVQNTCHMVRRDSSAIKFARA